MLSPDHQEGYAFRLGAFLSVLFNLYFTLPANFNNFLLLDLFSTVRSLSFTIEIYVHFLDFGYFSLRIPFDNGWTTGFPDHFFLLCFLYYLLFGGFGVITSRFLVSGAVMDRILKVITSLP